MNFLSNQNGIINVETDLNKLTRYAEAIKDAIPAQDYEYKVNDLEALLRELHKVIVAGAQAIAHDAEVAQELAEYRRKKRLATVQKPEQILKQSVLLNLNPSALSIGGAFYKELIK